MRANAIVYDCEIKKSILGSGEKAIPGIEYCAGWRDFKGMGVSCIGAYDFQTNKTHLFMDDNIQEFVDLVRERAVVVSFNGDAFDGPLVRATYGLEIPAEKSYDILAEMWEADGLTRVFESNKNAGYGLDRTCEINLGIRKSGHGALAPVHYQQGKIGKLTNYCLNDIHMTVGLVKHIVMNNGLITNPKRPDERLQVKLPAGAWL